MKSSDFAAKKDIKFENKKVRWAKLISPDTKYEPAWKIDIELTDDEADQFRGAGFTVRTDADGIHTIQAKRKCRTAAGQDMSPPVVVDRNLNTFTKGVGNGSVCNIACAGREYKDGKCTLYLNAVQVVDHIEAPTAGGFSQV